MIVSVKSESFVECKLRYANTTVKRFWSPAHQFPAQTFNGKHTKLQLSCKLNETKLKRSKQSVKGIKRWGNGKLQTFRTQHFFKYGFPINLSYCFKLSQKSYTLLKHCDLLTCVFVCNSFSCTCAEGCCIDCESKICM